VTATWSSSASCERSIARSPRLRTSISSLDNYGTHGHANVENWLAKHPRFQLHFVPTSSSWLNMVECWFGLLTEQAIRRGSFGSVPELIAAIQEYLDSHNDDPKPFIWAATVEELIAKVRRGRAALQSIAI
jgi:hypothetical protein